MKHGHWVLAFALLLIPTAAGAANGTLYVSPEKASYTVGETFEMRVLMDTDGAAVNAAEAEITFNPTALSVEDILTDGSILEAWPTPPEFSNLDGSIRFTGWAKTPYTGKDGHLITVRFKALRTMASNARLAAGAILAADGQGSNIITSMRSGVYTVEPKEILEEIPLPRTDTQTAAATTTEAATTTPETAPVELRAPTLNDYAAELHTGERIVIKGHTEPNAHVFVWLARGEEKEQRNDIMSSADGSFVFASDTVTEAGVYQVWAEAQEATGARTPLSNKVTITITSAGFAAAAFSSAELLVAIIPYLALLIAAGLGAGYLYHRHTLARHRV